MPDDKPAMLTPELELLQSIPRRLWKAWLMGIFAGFCIGFPAGVIFRMLHA